ncbi:hypothetical protein HD806DRAFT_327167 [Xylariaceae sp. AK1471]|nr:hypothetical protein HD806DRAFT_327167 [Xylariaceae sp. AK1471]
MILKFRFYSLGRNVHVKRNATRPRLNSPVLGRLSGEKFSKDERGARAKEICPKTAKNNAKKCHLSYGVVVRISLASIVKQACLMMGEFKGPDQATSPITYLPTYLPGGIGRAFFYEMEKKNI